MSEKPTVEKGKRVSVLVREGRAERATEREKKPGERARLLLAGRREGEERGRREKKNTMSTVKRPRGRVSELALRASGEEGQGGGGGGAGRN